MGVRAVLFDFHETLISADRWMVLETRGIATEVLQAIGVWNGGMPEPARARAEEAHARLRAISRDTGIEYSAPEIARIVLAELGLDGQYGAAAVDAAVETLFRSYLPDVRLKPSVAEGLDGLARAGYRMGIVSNATYGSFIAWALEALGVGGHFEHITVSADVGLRKPRREIFDAALAAMGLPAAEAVYVGNDYLKDVVGAKLAGLRAIWLPDPGARDDRPYTRWHPDAVADRMAALPGIIAPWRAGRVS
jgi:putative hydrolase of the HAD superfamily